MAVRAVFWGVWGGFPPIIGRTGLRAERGGLGRFPPILGRTRPPGVNRGGPGRGGSNRAGPVRGISRGVVCSSSSSSSLSVCPFLDELVRGVLPDCDETFGGGQGPCQERLSPEPAQLAKVRARKGREIQIWAISH